MKTLVYKRTHNGDPKDGCFGFFDCMGKVRSLDFKAVIGIGAITKEARQHAIDGRVNWIGIGPRKTPSPFPSFRGPEVRFKHFIQFASDDAPLFSEVAPHLAKRFYRKHPARYVLNGVRPEEQAEIDQLLKLALKAPPSKASRGARPECKPKKRVC